MKAQIMIKSLIFLSIIIFNSCSNEEKEQNGDILSKCTNSETRVILEEFIPATVKSIEETDYFFNDNRFYLEVNAETYLPELADQYNETKIRIFAPGKNLGAIGKEVMIKGTIVYCITTDHGRTTNNIWDFYLIIDEEITNN